MHNINPPRVWLASRVVEERTGKSRSTLWRWERDGRFPRRRRIGPNSIAYASDEVDEWSEDPESWAVRYAR